jgi:hypothetical protein
LFQRLNAGVGCAQSSFKVSNTLVARIDIHVERQHRIIAFMAQYLTRAERTAAG